LACIPAYFLSAQWMQIPIWLYTLVIIAAFAQVIGWCIFLFRIVKSGVNILPEIKAGAKILFQLAIIALSIKLLLQFCSTIPKLSTWAFGFRPIIIGYLHLVFLGIFTLFILGYASLNHLLTTNRQVMNSIWIFVFGVFLNEIFLMAEGFGAITYNDVPYAKELLLAAAGIMFIGILKLNFHLKNNDVTRPVSVEHQNNKGDFGVA
jgi:hypothetical protein